MFMPINKHFKNVGGKINLSHGQTQTVAHRSTELSGRNVIGSGKL